jgi:hypothetical protein
MNSNGAVEIVDFSFSLEPKRFRINDDVFECSPELPLNVMARAANIRLDPQSVRENPEHALDPIVAFFDEIFIGDSSERFKARLTDRERPIGLRHITHIIPWLLEVYGLRPTELSSSSSTSPENDGTTSTDGASSTVSTPSDSPHGEDSTSSTTTREHSLSAS